MLRKLFWLSYDDELEDPFTLFNIVDGIRAFSNRWVPSVASSKLLVSVFVTRQRNMRTALGNSAVNLP